MIGIKRRTGLQILGNYPRNRLIVWSLVQFVADVITEHSLLHNPVLGHRQKRTLHRRAWKTKDWLTCPRTVRAGTPFISRFDGDNDIRVLYNVNIYLCYPMARRNWMKIKAERLCCVGLSPSVVQLWSMWLLVRVFTKICMPPLRQTTGRWPTPELLRHS